MKKKLTLLLSDKLVSQIAMMTFILVIAQLAILAFFYRSLPSQVPLFYSLPWGETQLAPVLYLFLFPALSIVFGTINVIVLIVCPFEERFLSRVMGVYWLFGSLLSTIGLVKIIFLIR